jgi:aspartate-semialdehyde dehydrogenase
MKKVFNIAVVGATGLVGRTMLKVLEERNFPVDNLTLLASERGAGTMIPFKGRNYTVQPIDDDSFNGIDIALFSAGKDVSVQYGPVAVKSGCVVIDNGSYWRMHSEVPLVVPEVNPEALEGHNGIIANPNCSTIQMVVALNPISKLFGLKRLVVSTYQSITGAGQKGYQQLMAEIEGSKPKQIVSNHPVAFNTIFHKITEESGYSEEEIKMEKETRKILNLPELDLTVTCVRLPILGGHGESVNIETNKPFIIDSIRDLLASSPGIVVLDNPQKEEYPTPIESQGKDDVFVGRIRRDNSIENGVNLWIVADNVRKGAASNAVQIAELVVQKNLLKFETINF